jgi:arylsulfatase A-like enzyme
MLGDHNDQGKTMPWEGSAHVPMVVTGPNVPQARHVILPVTIMDLAATFLDYGAGSLAPGMTSQSMKGRFPLWLLSRVPSTVSGLFSSI